MIDLKQKCDTSPVAVMRQALNEVVTDRRFLVRKSVTPVCTENLSSGVVVMKPAQDGA